MAGLIQDSNTNVTRKVLSDISNLNRNQTRTSRKKKNRKLTAGTDEPFHEKCIGDEGFLHNHQECMKAQHRERALEMDYFFKTLGLANGFPKELPSLKRPESPLRSPPRLLEEILEEPILDRSFCHSPLESADDHQFWTDWKDRIDCFSFNIIDPLKFAKH